MDHLHVTLAGHSSSTAMMMEVRKKIKDSFKQIAWAWFWFYIFATIATFLLCGCERDIKLNLKDQAPRLVIEATIENGQPPVVLLSRSLDFFSQLSPLLLSQSLVHGADVFVSNGSKTQKLKEYQLPVGGGLALSYYTLDSSSLSASFKGALGESYSMRLVAEGKEFTATTTIPQLTKKIDSIWWKPAPPPADPNQVIVMVKATDPPGFGDYIRYFTKRNSEPYLSPLNATFDDLFVDGTSYELPVERGVDRNSQLTDDDRFFKRGDTVTLKLCNIDKATYDFWRTMEFSYASVGNPFSTPVKVASNINGNALGYFGGYACQFRTIIIPK